MPRVRDAGVDLVEGQDWVKCEDWDAGESWVAERARCRVDSVAERVSCR